jgi:hypothetical protein
MSRDVRQEQRIADPVLAAVLADLRADVPADVDLDELRRSIVARAELVMARKRARWRGFLPRPLVPIAAAASIALALWAGPGIVGGFTSNEQQLEFAAEIDQEQILIDALGSDISEQEFRLLVTGRANPEALLAFVIGEP